MYLLELLHEGLLEGEELVDLTDYCFGLNVGEVGGEGAKVHEENMTVGNLN